MLAGCDLSAALDQSALLPAGPAYFSEVRSAESGEFSGGFGELDGIEAVARSCSQFVLLVWFSLRPSRIFFAISAVKNPDPCCQKRASVLTSRTKSIEPLRSLRKAAKAAKDDKKIKI